MTLVQVTLLGPQRRTAAARAAVAELIPAGPIATINSGWREREPATEELGEVLGGRMINLELYRRWREVIDSDPEYAAAERRLTELLAELQEAYAVRLRFAMAAVEAVARRTRISAVHDAALADAIRTVRDLDAWHLGVVAETRQAFYARTKIGERDNVVAHRAQIAALVEESAGLVVTGGHVGVLLQTLHVFGLAAVIKQPLITWSAGAMALSERIVLFHDHGPPGRKYPELYGEGLGAYAGLVVFPHPKRRLRVDDHEQMTVLAGRLRPRIGVLLPDGVRLDLGAAGGLPTGARYVAADGAIAAAGDGHG